MPTWVSPDGKKVRGVGVGAAGHSDTGGKPSNANVTVTGLGAVYLSTCMAGVRRRNTRRDVKSRGGGAGYALRGASGYPTRIRA